MIVHAEPSNSSGTRRRLSSGQWTTVGIVVVALVLALLAQTTLGRRVATAVGLRADPPSYTELFFENAAGGAAGSAQLPSLTFVVRSHESTSMQYQWSASLQSEGKPAQILDSGRLTVKPAEQARQTLPVGDVCGGHAGELIHVVISLSKRSLSIQRVITCGLGGKP